MFRESRRNGTTRTGDRLTQAEMKARLNLRRVFVSQLGEPRLPVHRNLELRRLNAFLIRSSWIQYTCCLHFQKFYFCSFFKQMQHMRTRVTRPLRPCIAVVFSCLTAAACFGCGSSSQRGYIEHQEELFPVDGIVFFEGQPCKNAVVVFHRMSTSSGANPTSKPSSTPLNPRGECNEAGEFQLYTYSSDDGAPAGEYQVTVSWRDPEGTGREETFPELLPNRYQNQLTSGLTARINEGATFVPPFQLKR